jgi:hypothetical protein
MFQGNRMARSKIVIIAALSVAALGGAFFGLFSCGGYVWHWHTYEALAAASLIVANVMWRPRHHALLRRLGLLIAFAATYLLVQAATAPLYWAKPFSVNYWHLVLDTIANGPC